MRDSEALELLERANPLPEEEMPSPRSSEALALRQRILLTKVTPPLQATRHRRGRRRGPLLAATAALVALAAVVTLPRALPEEHLGASPAAAAVLERAADAASAYDSATGRYAYTKAQTLYAVTAADAPPFSALIPRLRETWVAADGSGRIVETTGEPIFLGTRDRARWLAAGSLPLASGRARDDRVRAHYDPVSDELLAVDPSDLSLKELDQLLSAVPQLPADPTRLGRLIRAYAEYKDPPVEAAIFNQISGLLHSPLASAELRAALYRVLASVDGVRLGGERRDSAGRLGTVITSPAGYGEHVRHLLIDPDTGAVLAEEEVLTKRVSWIDGKPGDVVGAIVVLEQGWVDSTEARPPLSR